MFLDGWEGGTCSELRGHSSGLRMGSKRIEEIRIGQKRSKMLSRANLTLSGILLLLGCCVVESQVRLTLGTGLENGKRFFVLTDADGKSKTSLVMGIEVRREPDGDGMWFSGEPGWDQASGAERLFYGTQNAEYCNRMSTALKRTHEQVCPVAKPLRKGGKYRAYASTTCSFCKVTPVEFIE